MKKFAQIMAVALVAVFAITVLVACGYPADPKKAEEKLKKDGYTVSLMEFKEDEIDEEEGVVAVLMASKLSDDKKEISMVMINYFNSAAKAKEAYNDKDFQEFVKKYEEKGGKCKLHGKQVELTISGSVTDLADLIDMFM